MSGAVRAALAMSDAQDALDEDVAEQERLSWADDVDVRNALLHAVEAVTGRRAHPYDIACLAGSLMGDGFRLVKEDDRG